MVTGASMGIGEAIAKSFADQGAGVVLLSRDAARVEAARGRVGHSERTLALASVETISGRVVPQTGKDPRTAELLEVAEYSSA